MWFPCVRFKAPMFGETYLLYKVFSIEHLLPSVRLCELYLIVVYSWLVLKFSHLYRYDPMVEYKCTLFSCIGFQ